MPVHGHMPSVPARKLNFWMHLTCCYWLPQRILRVACLNQLSTGLRFKGQLVLLPAFPSLLIIRNERSLRFVILNWPELPESSSVFSPTGFLLREPAWAAHEPLITVLDWQIKETKPLDMWCIHVQAIQCAFCNPHFWYQQTKNVTWFTPKQSEKS